MGCREVQRVVSVPSSPSLERNRKPMKLAPSIATRNTSTQMYYHFNHFAHQLVSATRSGDSAHLRDSPNSSSALLTRPLSGCLVGWVRVSSNLARPGPHAPLHTVEEGGAGEDDATGNITGEAGGARKDSVEHAGIVVGGNGPSSDIDCDHRHSCGER
ncbi:hypothetical protein PIB30_091202 [Stylosanthes scabra]|uniref:Uncharacterized protein n=1 Tax=Stylosanthes scabra TaxID=79078 RepID=A0ABU6RV69_9FABA|nr:hypothetical protein [Stylosanthes scabra]